MGKPAQHVQGDVAMLHLVLKWTQQVLATSIIYASQSYNHSNDLLPTWVTKCKHTGHRAQREPRQLVTADVTMSCKWGNKHIQLFNL